MYNISTVRILPDVAEFEPFSIGMWDCFAAVALAQQPYNWKDNPAPVSAFAPVFKKIWTASFEASRSDPLGAGSIPRQTLLVRDPGARAKPRKAKLAIRRTGCGTLDC